MVKTLRKQAQKHEPLSIISGEGARTPARRGAGIVGRRGARFGPSVLEDTIAYSVMYDSGPVPRSAIFSPRQTSTLHGQPTLCLSPQVRALEHLRDAGQGSLGEEGRSRDDALLEEGLEVGSICGEVEYQGKLNLRGS